MADYWTTRRSGGMPNDADPYLEPSTPGENFKAAYDEQIYGWSQQSRMIAWERGIEKRDSTIEQLTGTKRPVIDKSLGGDYAATAQKYLDWVRDAERKFPDEPWINDLAGQIYQDVADKEAVAFDVQRRAGTFGTLAGFAGGAAASFEPRANPLNVATLPLGWGRTIAQRALANTGIGFGSEMLNQYTGVQSWRQEAGLSHGFNQALAESALTGVAGGVLGAGLEVTARGLARFPRLAGKTIDELRNMRKGNRLNVEEAAAVDEMEKSILQKELGQLSDEEMLDLMKTQMGDNLTADEAAAERALRESIETIRSNPFNAEDIGGRATHEARLQASVDALEEVDGAKPIMQEEPPLPLADTAESIARIPKPNLERVKASELNLDPKNFQFKADTDELGANMTLKSVKDWDPEKAGFVHLFEAADGKMFVANGHQRANLAKRLISEGKYPDIEMAAIVWREADGFTPERAMARAAMINIGEGTGSIADAARIFRDAPELIKNLPETTLVSRAKGFAKLSDEAFQIAVTNRNVNEAYAAMIGEIVEKQELHAAILRQLIEEGPENLFQAESIVRQMREDAFDVTSQETLFGAEDVVESLYKPKAKVLDKAVKLLREDKRTFANLVANKDKITKRGKNKLDQRTNATTLADTELALHNLTTLANRKGEIADALTEKARQAKETGKYAAAARELAEIVRKHIEAGHDLGIGARPDAGGAVTGHAGSADAPTLNQAVNDLDANLAKDTQQLFDEVQETVAPKASTSEGSALPDRMKSPNETKLAGTQEDPSQRSNLGESSSNRTGSREGPSNSMKEYEKLLSGIEATPYTANVRQASKDYKVNLVLAKTNKPILDKLLGDVVKGVDGANVYKNGGRVKEDNARLQFKLASKGGDGSKISDYLGGRIIVDNPRALVEVLGNLREKGARFIEAENKMAPGKDKGGWRDVSLQVETSPGFTAELQITPKKMAEISDGPGHKLYEKWRSYTNEELAKLSPEQNRQRKADDEAMQKMYDDSWNEFVESAGDNPPLGKSFDDTVQAGDDFEIPTGFDIDADGNITVQTKMASDVIADIRKDDALVEAVTRCAL